MNLRAYFIFFQKFFSLTSLGMNISLLLGPQVGTRPLVYRLKYLQNKKKTNKFVKFPNSFILKYYIVCFACRISLRYIGKISEKNSWPPPTKSWIRYWPSAPKAHLMLLGSRSRTLQVHTPMDQNFLNYMQLFGKNSKIVCWYPSQEG